MAQTLQRDEREAGAFAPIGRPRITERLRALDGYPVALLIAPAGYGKSVALRQYLETVTDPAILFTLRTEHATLLGFLRGLTEALKVAAPHAITTLAGAYERNRASARRAPDLARWMQAHLESYQGVIAIDGLHIADDDPEVARFTAALIEATNQRVRWILASRSTAGLPVGTWLAYRDADLPLDEHDLRFTLEEVREAARTLGLSKNDQELKELLALTDGWPAAMGFALRMSTRLSELRSVSAITREMIYRLLEEQVYAGLDDEERGFLEVAISLPSIDVGVLERAGFDRALTIAERIRERTGFIYEESPGFYQCHELFRDFLHHRAALGGKRSQQCAQARAAEALEAVGDVEHAISSYVASGLSAEIVRLLERHGFDLLERARGDVIARAIDALEERTRRENPTILALQGTLHATAGRFARAESIFRRALARAGDNRDLIAVVSLRLASILANQRQDVTELLSRVSNDSAQSASHRAAALSLIAGQRAVAGDLIAAREAVDRLENLIPEVDSDAVRVRAFHHTGIAFHHLSMPARAFEVLLQASDLAFELHLYSTASRANAVLSNLSAHEDDDVVRQLKYAEAAAMAAAKAGDTLALQTAHLQMLSAEMSMGEIRKSIEIEARFGPVKRNELAFTYVTIFKALRSAWEGRFHDASHLLASCWTLLPFTFERILCGSEYGLCLALDGQRERSTALVADMLELAKSTPISGRRRIRSVALARMFCAVAEAINGRSTFADRALASLKADDDDVIALALRLSFQIVSKCRHDSKETFTGLREAIDGLASRGYADVAQLLGSVDRAVDAMCAIGGGTSSLTTTEVEVLRLLAGGLVPKEIAARRECSVYTVRVHIANVIAKLGCHGRTDAIRKARDLSLI